MKALIRILAVAAFCVMIAGCAKQIQTVTLEMTAPTASPTPVPATPEPEPTPAPTAEPAYSVPTITPKITFVPMPTTYYTPDSRNNTPTPSPAWASPYPSPTGSPLVEIPPAIQIATVASKADVKKRSSLHGSAIGTVKAGFVYRAEGTENGAVQIEYNGSAGFVPEKSVRLSELIPKQNGLIRYKAASLNIHGAESSSKISRLAKMLSKEAPDVVGIQEVKRLTETGNGIDWLERLSSEAGYPYYAFCKTLNYDGGEYGTAILSRFPILYSENWRLDVAKGKEPRSLAYACILTENGPVHFFNTHLCASDMHLKSINIASMVYTLRAAGVAPFIVTGDFNCSPPRIYRYMKDISFANMELNTFGNGSRPKIIDNILYSEGITVADVHLVDAVQTGATDHYMVVADFYVLPEEE